MQNLRIAAAVAVLLGSAALAVAAPLPDQLAISLAGPPQDVFIKARQGCDPNDIPDAPARAFRDAAGRVHLLAAHLINRAEIGPDLDHVIQDCRVLFRGAEEGRPELFDDRGWLAATYTSDGSTVFALVHDEYQGDRHPTMCPTGRYIDCWYNTVTMAVSHDGGASFTLNALADRVVAALPYPYDGDRRRRVGFFNPTNIIERDGFLYAMAYAERVGAQEPGSCLMRTDRIADPHAWRGWDGRDFTVAFVNPYGERPADPDAHVCKPVGKGKLRGTVSSLSRHLPSGLYIAMMLAPESGPAGRTGVLYSLSADLIDWSEPALLLEGALPWLWRCGDGAGPITYPSLLDPGSPDRNFATVGDRPELYLTRFNPTKCALGMDRDLLRRPLAITDTAAPAEPRR
jgi:hypothetical protein